jgi:uncharacterized membrane protein AbrB (regulator of aidB expression)
MGRASPLGPLLHLKRNRKVEAMAKIALIAGMIAIGALSGGIGAGLFGIGAGTMFGGSIFAGMATGAAVGASVGEPAEEFMYAGTAARFEGEDDET